MYDVIIRNTPEKGEGWFCKFVNDKISQKFPKYFVEVKPMKKMSRKINIFNV